MFTGKGLNIALIVFGTLWLGYMAWNHIGLLLMLVVLSIACFIFAFGVLYMESVLRLRWRHKKSWKDAFKLNAPYDIH